MACVVVAALVAALLQRPWHVDGHAKVRASAALALRALDDGDLVTLDRELAAQRGQPEFAYLFASRATPRNLGDALGGVVGTDEDHPLRAGVDRHAYDILLTDLAGTLALATYGTGERALPDSWVDNFIAATTLSGSTGEDRRRADQDLANKQNLLLLLSRGSWSVAFLQAVTTAYWEFDRAEGEDAWPGPALNDARYAPAPNGQYLTDGVLALAAALTANPAASAWAFTDFLPGTTPIEGSSRIVGNFTHFLVFEHSYPEATDGGGTGVTATLTALSSAIDAIHGQSVEPSFWAAAATGPGPLLDAQVLRSAAEEITEDSGCSWNPSDYWTCTKHVADATSRWVEHSGHLILNLLSFATFAPPPFDAIGITAAVTNATWYAIEGDYDSAGLSLAAAVPGLAIGKIFRAVKGPSAKAAAAAADEVRGVATKLRAGSTTARARELALVGATRVGKSSERFGLEKDAERMVAQELPGSVTQKYFNSPGCTSRCPWRRVVDIWDEDSRTAIEVKIGNRNALFSLGQVAKDVALLRYRGSDVLRVVWRFYPDAAGRVGPSDVLRQLLQKYRIPYEVYLP